MTEHPNTAIARTFLKAIEDGEGALMASLFHPDARQVEYPNRLKPQGDRRGVGKMQDDFERGKALMATQRYDVISAVAVDDTVAVRMTWTGMLAVPIGTLKAGAEMTSHSAAFFVIKDGKILELHNYDCFELF